MKKVTYTNISGIIFNIDEDAYIQLQNYLDNLNQHFKNTPEGKEVVSDIESRIAELLCERPGGKERVVSMSDIDNIINTLGKPEDIDSTTSNETESSNAENKTILSPKQPRKLYRDPYNAKIGGVCAGLANYFRIDPAIIRVLFLLFLIFYCSSFWIYIILWIALPKAITTSQRLEMFGEIVNIDTIHKQIKEDGSDSAFVRDHNQMVNPPKTPAFLRFLRTLFIIFLVLMAIPLLFIFLFVAIICFVVLANIPGFYFIDPAFSMATGGLTFASQICLVLLLAIPIISVILLIIKLLFNIKKINYKPFLIMGFVWILTIFTTLGLFCSSNLTKRNFDWDNFIENIDDSFEDNIEKRLDRFIDRFIDNKNVKQVIEDVVVEIEKNEKGKIMNISVGARDSIKAFVNPDTTTIIK